MIHRVILILILILAAGLRLWNLNSFPTGFNADEAALGYNAYSIMLTGKDEYGEILPLSFKSFGDYKPGLYVYLDIPFIAIFGLNEFAVRLPSALLGIATVLIIYYLSRKIFNNTNVALLTAFLLAISPWHLHFSRGAWETNVATFFIALGMWLFIKGLEQNKWFVASLVSLIASMYTYQSPRLVVPVLVGILIIIYHKKIFINKKVVLINMLIGFVLILPIIFQFISGTGSARFTGLSIFSDGGPLLRSNELRQDHQGLTPFNLLMHNKITTYTFSFLGHYLDHFKPGFLFIDGDSLIRNRVPNVGQFYLLESIFLFIGLIQLIRKRIQYTPIILVWVFAAPLASALTYQTPHALRSLNMVIPLTLVMGYGAWELINLLRVFLDRYLIKMFSKIVFYLAIFALVIFMVFEVGYYLNSYYVLYPKRYPLSWEHGFSEMVRKLNEYEGEYDKIVITDRYDQPYILVLFYKQYPPSEFQKQAVLSERDKFNFGTVRKFDKYEFKDIKQEDLRVNERTLFIGTPHELYKDVYPFDKVDFPNGETAFLFVKKEP